MEEQEKKTLARTKSNMLKNLDAINDYVEANGFPVGDHMVLDDIKDSVKVIRCIDELFGEGVAFERVQAPSAP